MKQTNERSPLKVLLLTTYPHGGAGAACLRLQKALQGIGVQADVLTQSAVGGRLPFLAERISFLPWERNKSVRFSFSLANFGTDISRHPAVLAADILHLHWWNQGFLSLQDLAALGKLGKPIVWTLHDMWAFTGGCHYDGGCGRFVEACGHCPFLRFRYRRDLSNQVWRRKQALFPPNLQIVTCSHWLAEKARSSSLLQKYPITDIPNPINSRLFKPLEPTAKTAFRERLGVHPDARLLLFAAMNIQNPLKGFTYFEAAMIELKAKYPALRIELLVVGKSNQSDLSALPYPIHSLGLIQDPAKMAEIYGAADVYVTPSLEENLPNTIMESLACATPAVGFNTGGIPEMIGQEIQGKVSPLRNHEQMAEDIAWVLEKEPRRLQLGQQARSKVEHLYSEAVVAKRYLDLYQSLTTSSAD